MNTQSARDLVVRPVSPQLGRAFVRANHYSGKVTSNSQLHLGAFLNGRLVGVAQFGPPLDRSKVIGLVADTAWNDMLELNRLVMLDDTPRNSESRFISQCIRLIRKHAPNVQWLLSFADGTQCGDGTIYRASGFVLTAIKRSDNLARLPDGSVIHKITLQNNAARPRPEAGGRSMYDMTGGKYDFEGYIKQLRGTILPGFQLRYIYFIDPSARARLTVPVLPFSAIDEAGAGMYLGERRKHPSDAPVVQTGEGGAAPTPTLQSSAHT